MFGLVCLYIDMKNYKKDCTYRFCEWKYNFKLTFL